MSQEFRLTAEGYDKLRRELEELKGPARMQVADAIREAKAHGDLRENAAYHEAKLNQNRLDKRIAELEKVLQLARIVEGPTGDGTGIQLGALVKLVDLEFGDEFTVKLVGNYEADPGKDLISVSSPLGEALAGRQVGDEIDVVAPAGTQKYRIAGVD
jgi:transcription elongation factor GreA